MDTKNDIPQGNPPDVSPPTEQNACPTSSCCCGSGKAWHWLGIALLVLVAIVFLTRRFNSGPEHEPDTPAITWSESYQASLTQAQSENKPVLLAFHASWCPPCKMMKHQTYHDPEVIKTTDQFVRIMVDVDAQGEVAGKYGIDPIPAYVVLNPNGTIADRFEGYLEAGQFVARLNNALEKVGQSI